LFDQNSHPANEISGKVGKRQIKSFKSLKLLNTFVSRKPGNILVMGNQENALCLAASTKVPGGIAKEE
jgi:hypothetical protein